MAHSNKETLSIIWCDNGTTDGKFTEGLVYTLIHAPVNGIPVNNAVRVQGNQIARQRQAAIETWQQTGTDWALWVDSDIVLTLDLLKTIWDTADKHTRPIVSGVYFVSKRMESSLMQPIPCIFNETGDEFKVQYLHPLPKNQIVKVDCAGMGLVLMHKKVIAALNEKFPGDFWFGENNMRGEEFIGEDIAFFRKVKAAGVPMYAHTGAIAKHMKRFSFDDAYYNLFWAAVEVAEKRERESTKEQQA